MGKAWITRFLMLFVLATPHLAWGTSPSPVAGNTIQSPALPSPAPDAGPEATVVVVPVPMPVQAVEQDPLGSAGNLVTAIRQGNWRLAAAFFLALIMFALGKVRHQVKWFAGDRGGAILVMVLSLAGALSTSLAAGMPVDWKMFAAAIGIAWSAVGGYTWVRKMLWPAAKPPAVNEGGPDFDDTVPNGLGGVGGGA